MFDIMKDSMTYQATLEDGRIEEVQRLLLLQGTRKFGAPDPSSEALLKAIENRDRLERMAVALIDAKSWQELLSTRVTD